MALSWSAERRTQWMWLVGGGLLLALLLVWQFGGGKRHLAEKHEVTPVGHTEEPAADSVLTLPRDSWPAAGIELAPAGAVTLDLPVQLTGKVTLNEDRMSHIFPLVEGRVEELKVQFGDRVKKGDALLVVQSKEVGQTKLQLVQDRLEREFAEIKNRWAQDVATNAETLIQLIREAKSVDEIEKNLQSRPLGDYRDKLMSAYIQQSRARKNLDRVTPLSQEGAVTGKQLLEAEADWNAARAALQSLIEQIHQDAAQAAKLSAQAVKEATTRVVVDETNLKILGFDGAAIADIDPMKLGEAVSHYPITAPFDGTVIAKDVVLLERVSPQNQILSIADLSTVWVTADIYEEHLPLLTQLGDREFVFRAKAWPDRTFRGKVFYTGDVVDESSRTLSLRAIADNADGLLKPGMFVAVELEGRTANAVLSIPLSAVFTHEGKSFAFVHLKDDKFDHRDLELGRRNGESVEVLHGIAAGESVVVKGGFALKSQMLSELLSEE